MKWLIASDIHGSAMYCSQLLSEFEKQKCDRLLLLGDILYHGPRNDLPPEYAPKAVTEMLNRYADSIFCVRGNCEAEVDQMMLAFPVMADYALIEVCGRMLFATHGHIFNEQKMPPLAKGDILIHGHTHIPKSTLCGDVYVLNPGSVSIPKEQSPHSYMTLCGNTFVWHELGGDEYKRLEI